MILDSIDTAETPLWLQARMEKLKENYDSYEAADLYLDILSVMVDNLEDNPSPDSRDQAKRYLNDYETFAFKAHIKPYEV